MSLPSSLILSVMYFEKRTRLPELAWLRKGLTDILVSDLAGHPAVVVVQRERLDEVLREQSWQLAGPVREDSAVRVGRLLGATALLSGSITVVGRQLRLDAQLLGVEQGTVLGTAAAEGPLEEAPQIVRALSQAVRELLPVPRDAFSGNVRGGAFAAAEANAWGERLRENGRRLEALEAFEDALAADPALLPAQRNYARDVHRLSGPELVAGAEKSPADQVDPRTVGRMVERLIGAMEADIGSASTEPGSDGRMTMRVPLQLRLPADAVTAILDSAQELGGRSTEDPHDPQAVFVQLSSSPTLNRLFVDEVAKPRRIYVRMLSAQGETVALYSSWHGWRVSDWVSAGDEPWVRIARGKIVATEAVVAGLPPDQIRRVTGVRVTVDRVPRERAAVRAELVETDEAAGQKEGSGAIREPTGPPAAPAAALAALEQILGRRWNPPIVERGWSPGYLPGADRSAIVVARVSAMENGRQVTFRLLRASNEPMFDETCLTSARESVTEWLADPRHGGAWPPSSVGVRIHCHLVKSLPPLNLIAPQEGTQPLASGSPRPGAWP